MRILFVHEVNYRTKVVFEMHDFPELLSLAGHEVTFIDFPEGEERRGLRRLVDLVTQTAEVAERAHRGAAVEVRTPGRVLPPPLDRLVASVTQVPAILRAIRDARPDAIVLYAVPTNGWQTVLIARRFGIPVLFRALDVSNLLRPTIFAPLIERAERFVYRNADAVSANNEALAEYVRSTGRRSTGVTVDYPGLDLDRFAPGPKRRDLLERYGLDADARIIQYMGTLYRFAGLDWLVDELAGDLLGDPRTHLMFVGGGEAEAGLRQLVETRGLEDRVTFTGWVGYEELADHLRLADVAVTPFAEEVVADRALPSKVLQYAGCGVPTVCTRLAGMQGMIDEGDGVVYRAPGADFASAIRHWLDAPAARCAAGQRARAAIVARCQWSDAVRRMESRLSDLATAGTTIPAGAS